MMRKSRRFRISTWRSGNSSWNRTRTARRPRRSSWLKSKPKVDAISNLQIYCKSSNCYAVDFAVNANRRPRFVTRRRFSFARKSRPWLCWARFCEVPSRIRRRNFRSRRKLDTLKSSFFAIRRSVFGSCRRSSLLFASFEEPASSFSSLFAFEAFWWFLKRWPFWVIAGELFIL